MVANDNPDLRVLLAGVQSGMMPLAKLAEWFERRQDVRGRRIRSLIDQVKRARRENLPILNQPITVKVGGIDLTIPLEAFL